MFKGQLVIGEPQKDTFANVELAIRDLLIALGADMKDQNFIGTPERVARMYLQEFTKPEFTWTTFEEEPYQGMVTLVRHASWTRCPHHLERVKLYTSVSYVPRDGRIVGLSKLARLCDYLSTGCILQETYTRILADKIEQDLHPEGLGVYTEAHHQCMQARGVKTTAPVIMKDLRGAYFHDAECRQEFLNDIQRL